MSRKQADSKLCCRNSLERYFALFPKHRLEAGFFLCKYLGAKSLHMEHLGGSGIVYTNYKVLISPNP